MGLRCVECDKKIWPDGIRSLWDSWSRLVFYFELQLHEGDISEETYSFLMEHLLDFKTFALDDIDGNKNE